MENQKSFTWAEIRKRLRPMNLRVVAKAAGVHESTLYRLMDLEDANPSLETRVKLTEVLLKHAAGELEDDTDG